jgi:hypothetical protein
VRIRLLIAVQVAGLALAAPAVADWQPLGSVDVVAGRDRDRLDARLDKPVEQLRFIAETADVACRSIRLTFRDGKKRKLADRRLIAGKPDVVDLNGRERDVRRIDFECQTIARAKAKISVAALFVGDQGGTIVAPAVPPLAKNVVIQDSQVNETVRATAGAAPVAVQPIDNIVIQNSQANDVTRTPPGAAPVAVQPTDNVVIQNSQANDVTRTPPGAAPVAVQPADNVVIQDAQANQPPAAPTVVQTAVAPAKTAAALKADELIVKNVLARGGPAKVAAINTLRMRGTARMTGGMTGEVLVEMARSGQIRTEITLQGMTAIQTYDGKRGWSLSPFLGQTEPQPLTGADLDALKAQNDFGGVLIDYEAKGAKIEFVADEDVEGTPAHKLRVTRKNGDTLLVYLDATDFLEFKTSADVAVGGQNVRMDTMIGDYKTSGGVLFAHSVVQTPAGQPGGGTAYTMQSVEVNPTLSAARFSVP